MFSFLTTGSLKKGGGQSNSILFIHVWKKNGDIQFIQISYPVMLIISKKIQTLKSV